MTTQQLQERARKIKGILYSLIDELDILTTSPKFDEDYKVEQYKNLNNDNFDRVEMHAHELVDAFKHKLLY